MSISTNFSSTVARQTQFIYDLKEGHGWSSFGICGYVPQDTKEEKKEEDMDRLIVTGYDSEDLGPQRWNISGEKLEQTAQEDIWVDEYGVLYQDTGNEYSEVMCRPPEMDEDIRNSLAAEKVRARLNKEEESWLAAHMDLWEGEAIWGDRCLRNQDTVEGNTKCVFNEKIPQTGWEAYLEGVIYTKENTEKSIDELRFFRELTWKVGHNIKSVPILAEERYAEWMDDVTGDGDKHTVGWHQRSFDGKDNRFVFRWWYAPEEDKTFTKLDYIMGLVGEEDSEYKFAKKAMCRASKMRPKFKHLTNFGEYNHKTEVYNSTPRKEGIMKSHRTYIGAYTRKDGTKVKAHYRKVSSASKWASIGNLEKANKKTMVVHYYKSTSSCPEGFMNIWTQTGKKVTGYKQERFIKVEHGRVLYMKLKDKAIANNYSIEFHDMDKEAKEMGKRVPSRQRARLLWNSPGKYIGRVWQKTLSEVIC